MNWGLEGAQILVFGASNKKSVATHLTRHLIELGARPILSVQTHQQKEKVEKLFPELPIEVCDLEDPEALQTLASKLKQMECKLSGIVHSVAFADFSRGKSTLRASRQAALQAFQVSCWSLSEVTTALLDRFSDKGSIVTVGISDTLATSYGLLGPIKAALEHQVAYLAKDLSEEFPHWRVNAVCPGPLKTASSAGIPGFIDHYLYAEQLTLRKENLSVSEVSQAMAFLLSPLSSGINASAMRVDAGMRANGFEQNLVDAFKEQSKISQ